VARGRKFLPNLSLVNDEQSREFINDLFYCG